MSRWRRQNTLVRPGDVAGHQPFWSLVPRRREQIRGRPNSSRGRAELFLRENPMPLVIGALATGVVIGLAIHYASRSEEQETKARSAG